MSTKHAAIYIRVSSEQQAEGASPDEQERECRALAVERGFEVVEVYRDVKAYRVGRKMIDPSGTRADRPGLVAMLRDASAGRFEVIFAWREDRLYRGLRPMINVLEVIQAHKIEVMLARETFDAKMAPVKAWVAAMELDALRERMTMGVKARLRSGKANTGQDRYGYRREGEKIVIVESEAAIVRQVFAWYIAGVSLREISRRLVEMGAEQKGSSVARRSRWSVAVIQGILQAAEHYASGIKRQSRAGEWFDIPIDPIIDVATLAAIEARRAANKSYPANHQKGQYLIGGLLYCDCPRRWSASISHYQAAKAAHLQAGTYRCTQLNREVISPDCPRTIGTHKADRVAWEKFVEAFDQPDLILAGVRLHIEALRKKAESVLAEEAASMTTLDNLAIERQTVIAWGRKRIITEADVSYQLADIDMRTLSERRKLAACHEVMNLAALNDWEAKADDFLADVRAGLEVIRNTAPDDPGLFELKRRMLKNLVEHVHIDKERNLTVMIRVDVLALAGPVSTIRSAGIYTRIQSFPARRCSATHASSSPPASRSSHPADRHP